MMLTTMLVSSLLVAPPSGRPPVGPLKRVEPRAYEITYEVLISTTMATTDLGTRGIFRLEDAPIVMPVIYQGTYSRVDADSVAGRIILDQGPLAPLPWRIDDGKPFYSHQFVMTIPKYTGATVRWAVTFRGQSWSSAIDDRMAQQATWPRKLEWPEEVRDGLQPQFGIESDDEIFAETIRSNGGDQLRNVSPYIAAKQIVQYCLGNVQVVGDGLARREGGILEGLEMWGAKRTAETGRGSPHDLVAVCVAMLRAAGIPARPVIGIEEEATSGRDLLVSWAEFYLPDAGWVPFDPWVMQGKGVARMNVTRPWPEFGTMEDLNRRTPLSYHFLPPAAVEVPKNLAVWGWDPRPGRQPSYQQGISISIMSRGRGVEDPR